MAEQLSFSGDADHQRQITVYFDTPKAKLRRNGWVLRVREVDGRFTQTIKRSGTPIPIERDEWEEEVEGLKPELKAIAKTPLADVVKGRQFRQLAAVCRCDVDRASRTITNGKSSFELTYDEGLVEARQFCEPIHEVELELKDGDLAALFASARKIVRQAPVKIGVMAKSERGFALADGKRNVPFKATPVMLGARMSVAEGFATVAAGCLKHFRMNESLFIAERDSRGSPPDARRGPATSLGLLAFKAGRPRFQARRFRGSAAPLHRETWRSPQHRRYPCIAAARRSGSEPAGG